MQTFETSARGSLRAGRTARSRGPGTGWSWCRAGLSRRLRMTLSGRASPGNTRSHGTAPVSPSQSVDETAFTLVRPQLVPACAASLLACTAGRSCVCGEVSSCIHRSPFTVLPLTPSPVRRPCRAARDSDAGTAPAVGIAHRDPSRPAVDARPSGRWQRRRAAQYRWATAGRLPRLLPGRRVRTDAVRFRTHGMISWTHDDDQG